MGWFSWITGPYRGANSTRHRPTKAGVVTTANDEDSAVGSWGRERLRLECRDLARNNPLAAGLKERFGDNVVGTGITPKATTSDAAWNKKTDRFWREWCKICDYRQRLTMTEIQRLMVMARITDGDMGFVLVKNGQIQPVEGERIRTPSQFESDPMVVDGVRLNANGIILGYYIHNRDKSGHFTGTDYTYVMAQNFVHVVAPKRTDQVRGIPEMAPCINAFKDLDDGTDATLQKWKNEAKNFYVIEGEGAARASQQPRRYDTTNEDIPPLEKVQTGTIHRLKKGKLVEIGNKTPGGNFSPFFELIVRYIGACFSLPFEFVLLNFTKASFSSNRTAIRQTELTFTLWQDWVVREAMDRIYNWRIALAIKMEQLPPAPVDEETGMSEWWYKEWQYPEFDWEDPQKVAQSKILTIAAGGGSLTEWARKRNRQIENILDEKKSDIEACIARATEINHKYPDANVTWRDFSSTNLPGQVTTEQAKNQGPDTEDDDDED